MAGQQRLARENFSMFGGVERRAGRHRVARIFRKDGVRPGKLQRFGKCALKPFAVIERAAEKQDLAADALALRKTRDGLIDDRFINAHGQIAFFRALIQERLDIGFGEYAAARGDGVNAFMR